ncbi:MAG: helix-turn-helix domain-containing protein [Candidatus Nanopelagicaceae bacterium]
MSLGQSLVSARKGAGMTIDELSSRTNIRISLLRKFEENNFKHAGGDTYARGHLRTIARVLNVDAEILLAQFDEEHAQAKRAIHEQLVENNATFAIAERKKLTNKQLITYSVIGIFLLLATSVIVNSLRQSASSPKPKPSASASAKASASATPSAVATANTYSSGKGVSVKLEAPNGSSWLFVSDAAGITLYSGRASQGEVFEFSSTEAVNLRIGNAGAVKLTVNGKEVPPLGADGEVVNVSYGVNS